MALSHFLLFGFLDQMPRLYPYSTSSLIVVPLTLLFLRYLDPVIHNISLLILNDDFVDSHRCCLLLVPVDRW